MDRPGAGAPERRRASWLYAEMAVLYRTNSQSRALEEAFRRAGVPYRLIGAISFYDRREVKDLLAYLRLVANPADDEAFLRAVGVPRRGIGDTSLADAGRRPPRVAEAAARGRARRRRVPDLRPNVREAFRELRRLIAACAEQARQLPPALVLEQVIRAIDYEACSSPKGPKARTGGRTCAS